ncbi:MAG TPA: hypothetical protein VKB78_11825 [Pirellulales bacterium]|nr:hypothetical protein [Pirellulales bacterium]
MLAGASRVMLTILSAAALLSGGCGPSANSHQTARLEGKVNIDNQPIARGRIQFFPIGPGQPDDAEISSGHYVAEHVPSGKVRVNFTATKETGKMIDLHGQKTPETVTIIPEKYRSGTEIEVNGDNPNQDFNLLSKPSSSERKRG